MEKTKIEKCRNVFPDIGKDFQIKYFCKKRDCAVCEKDCDSCDEYKSRYIEYPITVNSIKIEDFIEEKSLYANKIGKTVAVRPCGEQYGGKTYLGIFLGELAHSPYISYNDKTGELGVKPMFNPAMFVPELNKIVFGMESWWKVIESEKDFSEITDGDINNVWYVQLAKKMFEK